MEKLLKYIVRKANIGIRKIKQKLLFQKNRKASPSSIIYSEKNEINKQTFFQKDGKTPCATVYFKKNGEIYKQESFQSDGKTLLGIIYFGENGKREKQINYQKDGKTLKYIKYYDNDKITHIEFKNKKGEMTEYQCHENKLSEEFGESYVKHEIQISGKEIIESSKTLKEILDETKNKQFKIIKLNITNNEPDKGHGISIFCQKDEDGNRTFAIMDSNGFNKNKAYFLFNILTIEKYRELLGVKEEEKLVYLKRQIQKGPTCEINAIANIRFIGSLLKEGNKLKNIISCYNKATSHKRAIEVKEKNKELYEKVCNFLKESVKIGFIRKEIVKRIKNKNLQNTNSMNWFVSF